MSVRPEAIACESLREWLLLQLPAKVLEVNGARAPFLRAPRAGPYNITAGMTLPISIDDPAIPSIVALTTGAARTAAQVAADVNAVVALAGIASADNDGRLLLTGLTAPTVLEQGLYVVKEATETGALPVFGWNPGGSRCVRYPLEAPLDSGVADGWPNVLDCGPGFWVIIGKRAAVPLQPGDVRRDSHLVAIEMTVMLKDTNRQNSRSREAIEACVRCVEEVLLTDRGRYLGRNGLGDVMKVEEKQVVVPGTPWRATDENGNALGIFDTATYAISARVFNRPAST